MKLGIVSRVQEGLFGYQAWPSVCRTADGVLYTVCSGHRLGHICPFVKNIMYISHDGGETWSSPVVVNDNALDDRDAGVVPLGDGKLLLSWFSLPREYYWAQEEAFVRNAGSCGPLVRAMLEVWHTLPPEQLLVGSFVRLSRDEGQTWEAPVQVPVTAPHGPARLQNGRLLYFGKYDAGEYKNECGVVSYVSDDDGKTWIWLSELSLPEGIAPDDCHEPHAVQLPDGSLLGAIRVHGPNVTDGFSILLCRSEDGGACWSLPQPTGISGSPPHLLVHSSGAVILTYGRRKRPFGQRARVSTDGGRTWGAEIVLNDQGLEGDLGYPATAELADGSLITVYYQRLPEDRRCSILYTKWSLNEMEGCV